MVDLDQRASYEHIDAAHMHERLATLPQQCHDAFMQAQSFACTLPSEYAQVRQVVICAMGGSAIGAALALAVCQPHSHTPMTVWRNEGLPAYATGPETLVIASSKSGDTAETLDAYRTAQQRGCRIVALTTGGALAAQARADGAPLFTYTFEHTPREAIGWLTLPLCALLAQLRLGPDLSAAVAETVATLQDGAQRLGIDSPAIRNPAKRIAGQVMERLPVIYGAGIFAPVAQRWKTVLNENAKLLAAWEEMPDLTHNAVVGLERPESVWQKTLVIQLRGPADHPRNAQRFDLTTRLLLEAGVNQDTVRARGTSPLAQVFSLVQFGDWVSYYAAIMAGIDPTPTEAIRDLRFSIDN
jgi:glucose/mannose-6-phosphate isomerase